MIATNQQVFSPIYEYHPEIIWPAVTLATELADEANTIVTDVDTYAKQMLAAFVTGTKSFDEWDSYVAGFEALNIARYMEIYDAATQIFEKK